MSQQGDDPRREALIASLRQRFALAEARGDAEAKRGLLVAASRAFILPCHGPCREGSMGFLSDLASPNLTARGPEP